MKDKKRKLWLPSGKLYAIAIITFISIFLISCEIPESLTVKGDPGLYVPLGSPFAGLKDGERLEDMISKNGIKEMMSSGADSELTVFDVSESMAQNHGIDPNVQTYLVQYHLAEMPLDLNKYFDKEAEALNAKGDINIPDIPYVTENLPDGTYFYIHEDGGAPDTSDDIDRPFIHITLNDMVKLIKNVTRDANGRFGLEINYTPQFEENLEIKIPAFGINTYIKGTPDPSANPTKLIFADNSGTEFNPRTDLHKNGDDSELRVYARISGPCSGNLTIAVVFEWKDALINTEDDGDFSSEYPIGNSLGDFLGGGAVFKEVDGYVYMSGLDSPDSIVLKVDVGDGIEQSRNLQEAFPSFTVSDGIAYGNLTTSSFTIANPAPLNLAPVFESEGSVLKVNVYIEDIVISSSDDHGDKSIKFDLYVLLPMILKISEIPGKEAPDVTVEGENIRNNYVPLDLGNTLSKIGDGDLFVREDGKDNLINDIDYVEIILKDVDITILDTDNLVVLVKNKDIYNLMEFKNNESLKIDGDNLSAPFSPQFSVLLKKDTETSALFKVLRADNPKFDFKLDVKAKAKIDYTINF